MPAPMFPPEYTERLPPLGKPELLSRLGPCILPERYTLRLTASVKYKSLKLCRREPVFLLECAEKAGVIPEAAERIRLADAGAAANGVTAGGEAFFRDVLMEGQPGALLKKMGNIELAEVKRSRKPV